MKSLFLNISSHTLEVLYLSLVKLQSKVVNLLNILFFVINCLWSQCESVHFDVICDRLHHQEEHLKISTSFSEMTMNNKLKARFALHSKLVQQHLVPAKGRRRLDVRWKFGSLSTQQKRKTNMKILQSANTIKFVRNS